MTFIYLAVNYQKQNLIPMIIEYCLMKNDLGRIFIYQIVQLCICIKSLFPKPGSSSEYL